MKIAFIILEKMTTLNWVPGCAERVSRPAKEKNRRRRVLVVMVRSPRPIRAVQRARLWAITCTANQAVTRLKTMGFRDDIEWDLCAMSEQVTDTTGVLTIKATKVRPDLNEYAHVRYSSPGYGRLLFWKDPDFMGWIKTGVNVPGAGQPVGADPGARPGWPEGSARHWPPGGGRRR